MENSWYFTEYCAAHVASSDPTTHGGRYTWARLYSDFDRFSAFKLTPPLDCFHRLSYGQVIGLLDTFYEQIFQVEKPIAVLYEGVSNSFAATAFMKCEEEGIPFVSLAPSRLPGRIEVSMTGGQRVAEEILALAAQEPHDEYRADLSELAKALTSDIVQTTPDYMKEGGSGHALARINLASKYATLKKLRHIRDVLKYRKRFRDELPFTYQHGDPIVLSLSFLRRAVARAIRYLAVKRHYRDDVSSGKFIIYPLHFHPEASTSVLSPDYVHEISIIRSIAFRLPSDVTLVVKEHPSAVALNSYEFYRELSHLPNVELVAGHVPAKTLIRKCCGIVCLTSTLGFEAAVMGKPVLVFGNVFYVVFPNVRKVGGVETLSEGLKWLLSEPVIRMADIERALEMYLSYTEAGTFSFAHYADADEVRNIANTIVRRLARHRTRARGGA